MKPYNILHIIGGGEIGGAEQHVLTLIKNMDPRQYKLSLACLVDGPFFKLAQENNIPAVSFPMSHPLDLRPIIPLVQWARAHNIHLFHTHGSRANLIGRYAARRLNIPCVSTVHSSLSHDYLSPWAARLALFLDHLTLPLTAGIITVSKALQEEVRQRGGKNIRAIYNGLDLTYVPGPDQFKSYRQHFRALWNIDDQAFVIGSIARLHPAKGHAYLISAVKGLMPIIPNLHLLLIGEGPLHEELERELARSSIPYTLPGYIPQAAQALPAMDVFVLPSISEGMGLVLLEAIKARVPIIATQTGGIGEVIRHGQDGILVPPADAGALKDAIRKLFDEPRLREYFCQTALSRLDQFTVKNMISDTEEFYLNIFKNIKNKI